MNENIKSLINLAAFFISVARDLLDAGNEYDANRYFGKYDGVLEAIEAISDMTALQAADIINDILKEN